MAPERRSRKGLLIIILISVFLLIGYLSSQLGVQASSPLSCIVEDTRTGGGAAVEAWAKKLGFTTQPLRDPLWEAAKSLPRTGNCVITAGSGKWNPFNEENAKEEWNDIERWVAQGNTLIVMTTKWKDSPDGLKALITRAGKGCNVAPSLEADKLELFRRSEPEVIPTWWGGKLQIIAKGEHLIQAPAEMILAGSEQSSVLARFPLGQGRVYLLLDGTAWTNEGLDKEDNAAALARILKERLAPGGVLGFDEYRHGRGRIESFVTFFLSLPAAVPFSGLLAVLGLLWVWGRAARLGPPDEWKETERRTAFEYVQSVASIYERARAAPLALESVMNRVTYILNRRGLISRSEQEVLNRAQDLVTEAARPPNPQQEIKLVKELIQLRGKQHGL